MKTTGNYIFIISLLFVASIIPYNGCLWKVIGTRFVLPKFLKSMEFVDKNYCHYNPNKVLEIQFCGFIEVGIFYRIRLN